MYSNPRQPNPPSNNRSGHNNAGRGRKVSNADAGGRNPITNASSNNQYSYKAGQQGKAGQPRSSVMEAPRAAPRVSVRGAGGARPRKSKYTPGNKDETFASVGMNKVNPTKLRGKTVGHYLLGKSVGEGTFGKVKVGTHVITGEKVAIKVLEKSRIIEVADVRRVTREIKILKRNRHRNIIQLFEVLDTPTTIYLIMENADGGEMFDYIVAHQRVEEKLAAGFFHQIVDGAEYLHQMEVTHRDLKPENLLLQSSSEGWLIKIVDFGLSNTHEGDRLLQTACGSPCYAAPEMIAGKKYVGPKADIWSMGVILYALVCGYLPFENSNTSMLYKKILDGDYKNPDFISSEVKDLIRKILTVDPEKRYTIDQIRRHPWYMQCNMPPAEPMETADKMTFDQDIMDQLEKLQLKPAAVVESLKSDAHNHLTTSYSLLLNRKRRNKEKQELREKMYADARRKSDAAAKAAAATATKSNEDPNSRRGSTIRGSPGSAPSKQLNELKISGSPVSVKVPRLGLQGANMPVSSAVNGQLPTVAGGKPPAGRKGSVRQKAKQREQPTGSQTARVEGSGGTNAQAPQAPMSARPAGPADMPDGGPVVATSPWADHNISGERPVTRSSSRGESRQGRRPEQQRATVTQGLKGVEPPQKGGTINTDTISERSAEKSDNSDRAAASVPVVVVPTRPGAGGKSSGVERGGRKIRDPSAASNPNAPSNSTTSTPSTSTPATSTSTTPIATAVSSTSSKPVKALFNEMKKACKSRNIVLKQNHDVATHSIICETTFSATSPLLVFTMEVIKMGEKADSRVNVCKASLRSGKKGEFEKVCKVLFAAMKLL